MTDQPTIEETLEQPIPDDASEVTPPEPVPYHTLLEVWRALLKPGRDGSARKLRISPQWATKAVSTYPQVTFTDTLDIHNRMFDVIEELGVVLDDVIESDDQCLTYTTPQEDVQENTKHYLRLLTDWQTLMLRKELAWEPRRSDAAVELAALSEVHGMFFGEKGLVAHLDSIGMEFTESNQQDLQQALEATRVEVLGE